ncbi:unnamed protein product, partial [Laminaria digitata]
SYAVQRSFDRYFASVRAVYIEHGADSEFRLRLAPPAKAEAIEKARRAVDAELNSDLARLWSFANGSSRAPVFHDGKFLRSYALLTIQQAIQQQEFFKIRAAQYTRQNQSETLRDPRVGEAWFSSGWMPFAAQEGNCVLLVDHTPRGIGAPGQVIGFAPDPEELFFVADSLGDLL